LVGDSEQPPAPSMPDSTRDYASVRRDRRTSHQTHGVGKRYGLRVQGSTEAAGPTTEVPSRGRRMLRGEGRLCCHLAKGSQSPIPRSASSDPRDHPKLSQEETRSLVSPQGLGETRSLVRHRRGHLVRSGCGIAATWFRGPRGHASASATLADGGQDVAGLGRTRPRAWFCWWSAGLQGV